MLTILKYQLSISSYFEITMPIKAQCYKVLVEDNTAYVFALVETTAATEVRGFSVVHTGDPLDVAAITNKYVDYFILGGVEYHLYEARNNNAGFCGIEKINVVVTDWHKHHLVVEWTNPPGSIGTVMLYRDNQYNPFFEVNKQYTAVGTFNSAGTSFTFTSGIMGDAVLNAVMVKNRCANNILSDGVVVEGLIIE